MSLQPTGTITLGNLQYTTQASLVTATLTTLPGVNSATIALPSQVRFEAAAGDDGILELDSGDADGAGSATILTGKVRTVRRTALAIEVTIGDAGAELARLRPCATFEKSSASDVLRTLANDAGLDIDTIDVDLPLALYVADQSRTAAEHVGALARLGGALALVTGDGKLSVTGWPEGQAELALRYGRELSDYDVRDLPGPDSKMMAIGFGAAGSASAPDALRPTVGQLPDDAPSPGPDAIWKPSPALRVPKAAATASAGLQAIAGAYAKQARAKGFLMPKLRPGIVIEIQDVPDARSGDAWLITRVVHRLRPGRGGSTMFDAVTAAGGGLDSLLAAGLAALGSLF